MRQRKLGLSSAGDSGGGHIVTALNGGKGAHVLTRLDAEVQQAVDTAAAKYPGVSVVVICPSTSDVLGTRTTGTEADPTPEGVQAPGQIFELVTTAALLDHGAVNSSTPVGCPASASYGGQTFTNPDNWSPQNARFTDVFTHACDTGFIPVADKLTGKDLASEARDVFGLGLDWQTGLTTADGAVAELDGADKAAAAIGQGEAPPQHAEPRLSHRHHPARLLPATPVRRPEDQREGTGPRPPPPARPCRGRAAGAHACVRRYLRRQ
ncbi:penicillin-binding transpeptidase domain-containing protein [Streptomyces yokosukanensis]|uniref:penicillin-binding transpeptidase domain-containing protein n=1 Tax=Streptomyces yokosukanensis TaxID=67386 RepID=UPI00341F59E2